MAKEITDDGFQSDVIEASKEKPVLVDFCGLVRSLSGNGTHS